MTATRGRPRSFDRASALDSAIRLFWQRGYEATSIRDLTEELGIAAPSLYNAFGDKQHLFAEALRSYDATYGGFIEAALTEEPTATLAVARIFAEAPTRYTRPDLPRGCLVVSGDTGSPDPVVQEASRLIRQNKTALLATKIADEISTGGIPTDTDAAALAQFVLSVLSGLEQHARDGAPRSRLAKVTTIALRAWPTAA
ncbi:TetR/AcrR family transcriptional regulator [Lysinibacter cavernae]|uniref:AcrR family transcriptional regulator n=1 Tax=Lysinibacter cavernae TaxID=1640652 RepID=A0A7X5TS45_9MICO|nr:TetR/AcrR family transcriptional regulator [Lysinibacter cavernae]NIH52495.1 AcrR family transcriptional regulator [Lysinibacter cavernae]